MAGVPVSVERPSRITGALDGGLVLLTHLAALEVAAAVVDHLARLVAGVQVEPRGTGAHHAFPRRHRALVAAATPRYVAQICGGGRERKVTIFFQKRTKDKREELSNLKGVNFVFMFPMNKKKILVVFQPVDGTCLNLQNMKGWRRFAVNP